MTPRSGPAAADGGAPERRGSAPLVLSALGVLTAAAFVLRLVGVDQSLAGDEYFTYDVVAGHGLRGVWHAVYTTSITPPLHYVLAWMALKLGGDSTVLIRLPSLVFGTAIVPLIFVLGRRLGGFRTGLLAAMLLALGPFAIWYSDEARTYATMMFLVAFSTLALLRALDADARRLWWVLYAVSACAALWSHYTAAFVVAAEGLWALWARRDHTRALLLAQAAIVVGWLPWLPGFLEQRQNHLGVEIIDAYAPLGLRNVLEVPAQTLVGHPYLPLAEVPGATGMALAGVLLALVVAWAWTARRPARRGVPSLRSERGLMVVLALATPTGLLLYAVSGTSLYLPRNLSASLPALAIVVSLVAAAGLRALPRRVEAIAAVALTALLVVVAVSAVGDDDQRPPYRAAAHYLDEHAGNADPVVESSPTAFVAKARHLRRTTLDLYFRRPHPLYPDDGAAAAWRSARGRQDVWTVAPTQLEPENIARTLAAPARQPPDLRARLAHLGGPDGRAIARSDETLDGIVPVSVRRYRGLIDGRLEGRGSGTRIAWTFGRDTVVDPAVARGAVESMSPVLGRPAISGWAIAAKGSRLVNWVLLFSGRRLLAVSAGGLPEPDVARRFGPQALLSGFALIPVAFPADRSTLRVFAVVGDRASELRFAPGAQP
jgi:4-amino-4-deoxy-L-arabinose transferase-like glycosyltransferase